MNRIVLQLLFVSALCLLKVLATGTTVCTVTVSADLKQPVTVQCPITEGEITWSKDNVLIAADDKKYSMDATNRTLTIVKIDKTYSGKFLCSNEDSNQTVTVCVSPHVTQYDKAKNVIEGDPFQTDCDAWGYPSVTVQWTREKNFTGAEDRVIYKNGSAGINSVLRIENVQYEDSGFYTCTVRNEFGASANATIQVNVKDKLAALWPFLGICAEVAILCIIIFFYERRRAKILEKEAAQEESDHMTANNDAKVSDDVRHRK